jgi:hypothetical protein
MSYIYKIYYPTVGVTQFKRVISHDDYLNDIKPSYDEIDVLETAKKDKEENKKKASLIKKRLKKTYGDSWFTDKSPYWYAINEGVLKLPEHQGGLIECIMTLVNNPS